MGISILGHAATPDGEGAKQLAFRQKVSEHLGAVLSGILCTLSDAAAENPDRDFERTTWHLHMACNYLKLAASEISITDADAVDGVRERLTDRLFFLEAALLSVGRGGAGTRAQGLLEGLELMVAVSSLMPPGVTPLSDTQTAE